MIIGLLILLIIQSQASYFYRNSSIQNLPQITSLAIAGGANQYIFMGTLQNKSVSLQIYIENLTNYEYIYSKHKAIPLQNDKQINVLLLSKDNQILLVGTHHDKIRFYLFSDGELEQKIGIDGWNGDQNDIDISSDDNFLAVGNRNSTISIYQNRSIQTIQKQVSLNDKRLNSPLPLGNQSKQNKDQEQQIPQTGFNLPLNFRLTQTITCPNTNVSSLLFSHNSSKLYVAYENKSLVMYNLINYTFYYAFREDLNDDYLTSMRLSKLGQVLVTGSKKGVVRIYVGSSKGDKLILNQKMYEPKEEIMSMRIAQDNLMILMTTMSQRSFVYTRQQKKHFFNYDPDKSEAFRKKQVQLMDKEKNKQNVEKIDTLVTITQNKSIAIRKDIQDISSTQIKDSIAKNKSQSFQKIEPKTDQNTSKVNTSIKVEESNSTNKLNLLSDTDSLTTPINSDIKSVISSIQSTNISHPRLLSDQNNSKPQSSTTNSTSLAILSVSSSEIPNLTQPLRIAPTYLSHDDTIFIQAQNNNSLIIYVACQRTLSNCQFCKNNTICLSCIDDFYLSYNKCRRCDTGCKRCKGEICFSCQNGYYLNVSQAKCQLCNLTLPNCLICENRNDCSSCSSNYILKQKRCVIKTQQVKNKSKQQNIAITHANRSISLQKTVNTSSSSEQSKLLIVFIIICIVFIVLLIVVGFLVYYINKLAKGTGLQSETDDNFQEGIPRRIYTERRIDSESLQ